MTNILQWNCRGIRTGAPDLLDMLRGKTPAIVCIQETKLSPAHRFDVHGYSVYRKDVVSDSIAHGGVMLLTHGSIPARPLALQTSLQAVAARVNFDDRDISVCSLYLPPGITIPMLGLRNLIAELPPPLLLMGDVNAHHVIWGCNSIDTRGRQLEGLFNDEALCILNSGDHTHITLPSGRTSAIDLSVCSPELAPRLTWSVAGDPSGSDHFPVWVGYNGGAVLGRRPTR